MAAYRNPLIANSAFFVAGLVVGSVIWIPVKWKEENINKKSPLIESAQISTEEAKIVLGNKENAEEIFPNDKEIGEDTITLPRKALDLIYAPLFMPGGDELILATPSFTKLGVKKEDCKEISAIIKKTLQSIEAIEAKSARLVSDKAVGDYYVIDAYPEEANRIISELKSALQPYMPEEIADILIKQAEKSSLFGKFGKYRQEIYLEEIDFEGRKMSTVVIKFFNEAGREVISDQSAHLAKIIDVRYKHLFKKEK